MTSIRTNAERQSDYRRAKQAREFAGSYLGGRMDVSPVEIVKAKETPCISKKGYITTVTYDNKIIDYFYGNVIYLVCSDHGVYSVVDMLALWDESLSHY